MCLKTPQQKIHSQLVRSVSDPLAHNNTLEIKLVGFVVGEQIIFSTIF